MKVLLKPLLLVVTLGVLLLALPSASALATVETDWPVGRANAPRNAGDMVINFETGIEQAAVGWTIPNLRFSIPDSRSPWRYGDVRRGRYSLYPNGSFVTNGNFFAAVPDNETAARIDLPGGGASYFSALVSTQVSLSIEAYDHNGRPIADSGTARPNAGTGTFTRLTVDASPGGPKIAHVIFKAEGGDWLIDDLVTDALFTVKSVPNRPIGAHESRFDVVFIPDEDYGPAGSVSTWLPTFLDHIQHQIDDRLGGKYPVAGKLGRFNFYYTTKQGVATTKTIPDAVKNASSFADAYVIVHTKEFGDSCIMTKPSVYGAEGQLVPASAGRSFIHESGHGIFGLADEYDGPTAYFQPDPHPNIWATETAGRNYATGAGWNPDLIWKFTDRSGDWWKLGTTDYIMKDGTHFANGWGVPAEKRILWVLDQYSGTVSASVKKSLLLTVVAKLGTFSLVSEAFVTDASPDYLPADQQPFALKLLSDEGRVLGRYGLKEARMILGEPGYDGPEWLDDTTFEVRVPYFSNAANAELIETDTGRVLTSADLSEWTTPFSDVTLPAGWNLVAGAARSYTGGVNLFLFDGRGYRSTSADSLQAGLGYWVRFREPTYASLTTVDPPVPVELKVGWNLIGNTTGQRLSAPTGKTAFVFDGMRYRSANALEPGQGAWVRATRDEVVFLTP
jgi:hypothetical protein